MTDTALKKRIKVSVTMAHILVGRRANCINCPVALAMRDATGENRTRAYNYHALVGDVYYRLPERAKRWISKFDEGGEIKPFNFYLQDYAD